MPNYNDILILRKQENKRKDLIRIINYLKKNNITYIQSKISYFYFIIVNLKDYQKIFNYKRRWAKSVMIGYSIYNIVKGESK